jgi:hypothetical protein
MNSTAKKSLEFSWAVLRGAIYAMLLLLIGKLILDNYHDQEAPTWYPYVFLPFAFFLGGSVGMHFERYRRHKEMLSAIASLINATDQDAEKLEANLTRILDDMKRKIDSADPKISIVPPAADAFIQDPKQLIRMGEDAFDRITDISRQLEKGRTLCLAANDIEKEAGLDRKKVSEEELKKWRAAQTLYASVAKKIEGLRQSLDSQHIRARGA